MIDKSSKTFLLLINDENHETNYLIKISGVGSPAIYFVCLDAIESSFIRMLIGQSMHQVLYKLWLAWSCTCTSHLKVLIYFCKLGSGMKAGRPAPANPQSEDMFNCFYHFSTSDIVPSCEHHIIRSCMFYLFWLSSWLRLISKYRLINFNAWPKMNQLKVTFTVTSPVYHTDHEMFYSFSYVYELKLTITFCNIIYFVIVQLTWPQLPHRSGILI